MKYSTSQGGQDGHNCYYFSLPSHYFEDRFLYKFIIKSYLTRSRTPKTPVLATKILKTLLGVDFSPQYSVLTCRYHNTELPLSSTNVGAGNHRRGHAVLEYTDSSRTNFKFSSDLQFFFRTGPHHTAVFICENICGYEAA